MTPVTVSHIGLTSAASPDRRHERQGYRGCRGVALHWRRARKKWNTSTTARPRLHRSSPPLAYYMDHQAELDAEMDRQAEDFERRRHKVSRLSRPSALRSMANCRDHRALHGCALKKAVTAGLRRRGVDVVTAQEDGGATLLTPNYSTAPPAWVESLSARTKISS